LQASIHNKQKNSSFSLLKRTTLNTSGKPPELLALFCIWVMEVEGGKSQLTSVKIEFTQKVRMPKSAVG
jgi:hypothetical protein